MLRPHPHTENEPPRLSAGLIGREGDGVVALFSTCTDPREIDDSDGGDASAGGRLVDGEGGQRWQRCDALPPAGLPAASGALSCLM